MAKLGSETRLLALERQGTERADAAYLSKLLAQQVRAMGGPSAVVAIVADNTAVNPAAFNIHKMKLDLQTEFSPYVIRFCFVRVTPLMQQILATSMSLSTSLGVARTL